MPDHHFHPPRHEVMMAVDGEAAAALGDLARERWRRATGEALAEPEPSPDDPWPSHIPAHLTDVEVSVARTEPEWDERPGVYEIQKLTIASIMAAKSVIYLENQYFTSPPIAAALAARLAEPNGPEVVLISTGQSPSWFDQLTMDRARSNMLWRLRQADLFGRFRAFCPVTPSGTKIIVHSKVTVIDDQVARVGSANLNNRSGGFDTEAELVVEARTEAHARAIDALRDRLIGHFMACTGDAVSKARAEHGSLVAAIDFLNREGRLTVIPPMKQTVLGEIIATYHLGDPCTTGDSWKPHGRHDLLYAERVLDTRFMPR